MAGPLRQVMRWHQDGYLRAFRRGGYHAAWWIVVLDCGHAFHVSTVGADRPPIRPRKCQVCGYGFLSTYRKKSSDELLARLARIDNPEPRTRHEQAPCICGSTDYDRLPGDDGLDRNTCCGCH